MLTFLHISDLHFATEDAGTQFDRDLKIRQAILDDLREREYGPFAGIFVTGDITYNGVASEFARAKEWFEELRVGTGSNPEAFFVVPGNHDANRKIVSKDSSLWDLHQKLRSQANVEVREENLKKKLHDPFNFLAALADYQNFATEYDCPTSREAVAWCSVLDEIHSLEDGTLIRVHGLNTALLSDEGDAKGNLFIGAPQFHHFDNDPKYVNVVLCHHPHSWLMDGNKANDFFRTQAQIVLCGHEHETRCYMEDQSLRLFAGAVHPNHRESHWEPCYHVLRLSIEDESKRFLRVEVETRAWRDKDKVFGPQVQLDGGLTRIDHVPLKAWAGLVSPKKGAVAPSDHGPSKENTMAQSPSDSIATARRKLIVHFFRLGIVSRYQAVVEADVWSESDDALEGQARWTRIFDRAEQMGRLGVLWDVVAKKDVTLREQQNPFARAD